MTFHIDQTLPEHGSPPTGRIGARRMDHSTAETALVNPFASLPGAAAHSSYGRPAEGELLVDGENQAMAREVHAALHAVLNDPDFPCVGAKSVLHQGSYRFGLYPELGSPESTASLARDLYEFVVERPSIEGRFSSFIASFQEPKVRDEEEFERLLWKQLAALRRLDREHHAWAAGVSSDPASPDFSYSFAAQPFFVVGLSPATGRWARHFPWPTLVFNDHNQFQRLREEQQFERMRDLIHGRDEKLHGEANPMLGDFGAHSDARQYSGRAVDDDWRCPVELN